MVWRAKLKGIIFNVIAGTAECVWKTQVKKPRKDAGMCRNGLG